MTLFSLSDKKALVTGASRGIGKAIAIGLAHAGADVTCLSTSEKGTTETIKAIRDLGKKGYHITADLSKRKDQNELIPKAIEMMGCLDILVNNAGSIYREPAISYPTEEWDRVLEINLTAVFRISQAAAKYMSSHGGGKIIHMASVLSFLGGITVPAYTVSKHGITGLTKALANEWAKLGIQVNAIAPGYIRTDITQTLQDDQGRNEKILARIPAGRWGLSEDIVGAAIFLASTASNYVNGSTITIDGGMTGR